VPRGTVPHVTVMLGVISSF